MLEIHALSGMPEVGPGREDRLPPPHGRTLLVMQVALADVERPQQG